MPNYRKLASKQDKLVSKESGLTIQVNSGACKGRKGDLYNEQILAETKTCEKPQETFTIKKSWLTKISEQAFSMGKDIGMLIFSFGTQEQFSILSLKNQMNLFKTIDQLKSQVTDLENRLSKYEQEETR